MTHKFVSSLYWNNIQVYNIIYENIERADTVIPKLSISIAEKDFDIERPNRKR